MLRALGRHTHPEVSLREAAMLAGTSLERTRWLLDALVDANLVQEPALERFRLNTLIFAYARQLAGSGEKRPVLPRERTTATR
jgi:hypothetical protein